MYANNYNQNQQQAITQDSTGRMEHKALNATKHDNRFGTGIE